MERLAGQGAGERRLFPRFPFHRRAVLSFGSTQIDGVLIDLSLSGALFNCQSPLPPLPDEHCQLDILHGTGRCCVRAQARIAHAQHDLLGLSFSQLDFGALQGLMKIAEMNLCPPAIMKRELGALLKPPGGRRDRP